jgi:hypothetical protein
MTLASILLGSAVFLISTALLYAQILGSTKSTALTLKAGAFSIGSALIVKAFLPNLKLIFQLWASARIPESPNLTLTKELGLQFGIIVVFQIVIVLLANFAAYLLPFKEDEWSVSSKDIFIAAFLLALAILFSDSAAEFGELALMPEQVGFN